MFNVSGDIYNSYDSNICFARTVDIRIYDTSNILLNRYYLSNAVIGATVSISDNVSNIIFRNADISSPSFHTTIAIRENGNQIASLSGDNTYTYVPVSAISGITVYTQRIGTSTAFSTVINITTDTPQPTGNTLSYSTEHGTAPSSVSDVTELTLAMLPTLSATGYNFIGWYYESTFTTQAQVGDTISADTTLYAKWEQSGGGWHNA